MSSREFCSWQLEFCRPRLPISNAEGWTERSAGKPMITGFFGEIFLKPGCFAQKWIIISQVLWYVTPCWLASYIENHKRILPPYLGKNSTKIPLSLDCFTLKMEALCCSEPLVFIGRFSVTSHRTWIFISTQVQVSYLARIGCFDHVLSLHNAAATASLNKNRNTR